MGVGDQGGCEPKMKLLLKCKKSWGMGGGGGGPVGVGFKMDVNQELELSQKCKKKSGCHGVEVRSGRDQSRYESRIEVIVKMQKKAGVGGVRLG